MDTRIERRPAHPADDDEVVEVFDGDDAPVPSWADLLPPTTAAIPGDGAWAPPAPGASSATPPVEPLPPPPPFDWSAVELPPPPVVEPAAALAGPDDDDEVLVLDEPAEGPDPEIERREAWFGAGLEPSAEEEDHAPGPAGAGLAGAEEESAAEAGPAAPEGLPDSAPATASTGADKTPDDGVFAAAEEPTAPADPPPEVAGDDPPGHEEFDLPAWEKTPAQPPAAGPGVAEEPETAAEHETAETLEAAAKHETDGTLETAPAPESAPAVTVAPPVAAAPPAVPLPAPAAAPFAEPAPERTPAPAFGADVAPDGSDVLSLVAPPPAPPAPVAAEPRGRVVDDLVAGARDLFALGDFTGALELMRQALALDPHHAEALAYLERTEDTLVQMYESKLGRLSRKPRVLLQPDEIVWLNLDHRAGFVLAQIDGQVSLDDIFALSGMSRLDTAKILVELLEQGAIAS